MDSLVLTYVARVPEGQWPADFADVIVQLLGARLEMGPLNRFNQGQAREDKAMERLQSVQARNRSSSGKVARTSDDRLTRAWRGGTSSAFPSSGVTSGAAPSGGPVNFSNEIQIVEGKPGRPGRDPVFQATDTALQYRLEGDEEWTELFRFSLFNTEPERLAAIETAIDSKADAGQVYSRGQVDQALSAQHQAIVGDADERLDTLAKLGLALGNDDSFAANLAAKFGASNGLATLGEEGKIPLGQIPDEIDGVPLGMPFPWPHIIPPAKCIWATGGPISRTTYAEFFEINCPLVDAAVTAASTSVTGIASSITDMLATGWDVEGVGIPSGTTISAVGSGTITLSQAATAAATKIRIFPHGNGDGSSTFEYLAMDERILVGSDMPGGSNNFIPVGSNPGKFDHKKLGGVGGLPEVYFASSSDPEDGFGGDDYVVGVNPSSASSLFGGGTGASFSNYPPAVVVPYVIKVLR
ncbi:MAG: hypothetical protein JKP96_06715 [Oceanicaulis sp.]|nr:hypothetical protein [Oceanicaulis sp.]